MAITFSSCCTVFAKVIFILLNIVYLFLGLGMAGIGAIMLIIKAPTELITSTDSAVLPSTVIVCGVIMFVLAILGIIGAGADVWILILIYSLCMTILMMLQASGIGVLVSKRNGLQDHFIKQMKQYMESYGNNDASSSVIDAVQYSLECCGLNDHLDWVQYNPSYIQHYGVPDSCICYTSGDTCLDIYFSLDDDSIGVWKQGCNETFRDFTHKATIVVGGVSLVLASLQFLLVCLGVCLCGCIVWERCGRGQYQRLTVSQIDEEPSTNRVTQGTDTTSQVVPREEPREKLYEKPYIADMPTIV